MAKQFNLPVVRISFVTGNGVHIRITSQPRSVLGSNRSDAKVIGADFNVISTVVNIPNLYSNGLLAPVFTFDDSQNQGSAHVSSVYWDVHQTKYILEALRKSLNALGASNDFNSLLDEIYRSRTLVLEAQLAEAL